MIDCAKNAHGGAELRGVVWILVSRGSAGEDGMVEVARGVIDMNFIGVDADNWP